LQADSLGLYSHLQGGFAACTSLLSKDSRIGCLSSQGGDYGALWPIETSSDMEDWLGRKEPNILVLASAFFTKGNVNRLIESGYVRGILVLDGKAPSGGYSPVSTYPQKQFGLHPDSDHQWNPLGDDFAFQSFSIPMFQLDANNSADILDKATQNKQIGGFPQHAANLDSFMFSSMDSASCMRRGRCDPVGGRSVWSSLHKEVDPSRRMIMSISQMDSNAFFRDLAFGADAEVSGTIAQLLAATMLKNVHTDDLDKDIVFAWFTGESFGYVGSQRFVYDITEFECLEFDGDNSCKNPPKATLNFQKIKMQNIDAIIEMDQVGNLQYNDQREPVFCLHHEPTTDNTKFAAIDNVLTEVAVNAEITLNYSAKEGIPPSSLMSFLRANSSIPGVVISEFDENYTNKWDPLWLRFDGS